MDFSDEMWQNIGYVKASKYRTKVIKTLKDDKTSSQIAKETGININNLSNTLRQLREHELVECINPEVRRGRLYRLTDKGEEISKVI